MNDKTLLIYSIDLADGTRFIGYRTEVIYGYAHALSEQFLVISAVNGERKYYNWNLVQSFSCKVSPKEDAE